jgi:hypothetical protein
MTVLLLRGSFLGLKKDKAIWIGTMMGTMAKIQAALIN